MEKVKAKPAPKRPPLPKGPAPLSAKRKPRPPLPPGPVPLKKKGNKSDTQSSGTKSAHGSASLKSATNTLRSSSHQPLRLKKQSTTDPSKPVAPLFAKKPCMTNNQSPPAASKPLSNASQPPSPPSSGLRRSSRAKPTTTYVVDEDSGDGDVQVVGERAPVAAVFLSKQDKAKLKPKKKKAPLKLPSPHKDAPPAGLFLSKAERQRQQANKSKQDLTQRIEASKKLQAQLAQDWSAKAKTAVFQRQKLSKSSTDTLKGNPAPFPSSALTHVNRALLPQHLLTTPVWTTRSPPTTPFLPDPIAMHTFLHGELDLASDSTPPTMASLHPEHLSASLSPPESCHESKSSMLQYKEHYCRASHQEPEVKSSWAERYRPRRHDHVIGNRKQAVVLQRWLQQAKDKLQTLKPAMLLEAKQKAALGKPKRKKRKLKAVTHDDIDDSDDDFELPTWNIGHGFDESDDEEEFQANLLALSGPVGSGKSACVYACAEELGFTVIEINSSDTRSGRNISRILSEAVTSHQVSNKTTADEPASPSRVTANPKVREGGLSLSDASLVLIEDVDQMFDDDKGFWAALCAIVKQTKRPVILTSNETAPWLEAGLSPKVLHFERPSLLRLAMHGQMMLASRGLEVKLGELQQLAKQCHGDIRFFINTLQLLTTCKEDSQKLSTSLHKVNEVSHQLGPSMTLREASAFVELQSLLYNDTQAWEIGIEVLGSCLARAQDELSQELLASPAASTPVSEEEEDTPVLTRQELSSATPATPQEPAVALDPRHMPLDTTVELHRHARDWYRTQSREMDWSLLARNALFLDVLPMKRVMAFHRVNSSSSRRAKRASSSSADSELARLCLWTLDGCSPIVELNDE
eukprot:m.124035 g.124035  ORF g.124035 m.124035 type:complete len:861 (+) comp15688_c0_seq1:97-2679(+)